MPDYNDVWLIILGGRVLQYTSNFQYLMHTGINNDDTGMPCVLKITSVVIYMVDCSCEEIIIFAIQ